MGRKNGKARNGKPAPVAVISQSGSQFRIVGLNTIESKAPRVGENPERGRDEFYRKKIASAEARGYLEKQRESPQDVIKRFDEIIAGTERRDLMALLERGYRLSGRILNKESEDERVGFAVLYALQNYK